MRVTVFMVVRMAVSAAALDRVALSPRGCRFGGHDNIELHRTDVRAHGTSGFDFITAYRQLAEFGLEIAEVETEVEKGPNRHVAADAGKTIEVKRPHTTKILARMAVRASP